MSGLGKFVNDSPPRYQNCKVKVLSNVNGMPMLCLFAVKDIKEGTELRFVYRLCFLFKN